MSIWIKGNRVYKMEFFDILPCEDCYNAKNGRCAYYNECLVAIESGLGLVHFIKMIKKEEKG